MGLLVYTRKVGQKIRVGDEIEITVLEISATRVRIGFLAPKDVAVHRLEVWQRIQLEDSAAPRRERLPVEPRRKRA